MAPLQSNLLSDPEKKIAREYLKTEVKKMEENDEVTTSRNNNSQRNEGGDDHDDAEEEEDNGVYIPGAGLLAKLNARDLRRIDKETEFDKRFESLTILIYKFTLFSLQVLFRPCQDEARGNGGASATQGGHPGWD